MSFLDQLQQSTGLLTEQVKNTQPFGSYTPTASDYVMGVPQNRFVGNQFQMPTLGLQPGQNIPVFGGTYSPSPYTPAPFGGAFGSSEMTQPRINPLVAADPVAALRGGGAGQERDREGIQSGLERIGGMNLKINPVSGKIEVLDPNSLTSNLLTDYSAIQKFTPAGMISGLLGQSDYGSQLDRIRNQYGDAVADEIAATVQESYRTGTAPSGLLSGGLKPGTKVKVGNTPGFINSQGNFQAGTPIGEINQDNINRPKKTPKTKDDSKKDSSKDSGISIGGFTDADNAREQYGRGSTAGRSFGPGTGKGNQGQTPGGPGRGRQTTSERRNNTGSRGPGGGSGRNPGGPDRSSGGCFVEGTPIQMADGSTKEITTIKVGEETKGGIVQAKMEFMPQNIYNYKDVLVSGSHWVVEDNQLIAVEDSKHGVLTDRIEPVYTFKTSDNRIWINDIEFGDFETGTDEDWEPHFEMVRQKLNKELNDKY